MTKIPPSLRRAACALVAQLMLTNLVFVNAALASESARRAREAPAAPEASGPMAALSALAFDLPSVDDPAFTRPAEVWGPEIQAEMAPAAPRSMGPRAPSDAKEGKGLWTRLKEFLAEDWRQTKEDMRAIGRWFYKPIENFGYAWRRLREKLRSFRTRVVRAGKLAFMALIGRELDEEEDMVHTLLTAYIDAHGVEALLKALENSNSSELEQVALLARKVDDPVLQSQLLQRYVAREFLRMKKKAKDASPEEVAAALAKVEEGAAALEVSDPDPEEWGGIPTEAPPAPVYTPYYPFKPDKQQGKSLSMKKILIGLIGGVGLVLSAYFALTTMTMAPFLAFLSTVVSLIAMLRSDYAFGQQIVIQPPPHQGPWPSQPPTTEPEPLDPGVVPDPPGGGGGGLDPDPDPVPDPDPAPPPHEDPAPAPAPPPPAEPPAGDPPPAANDNQDPLAAYRDHPRYQDLINLNAAGVDELQVVPGVGPTLARRIVGARSQGPFRSLKDFQARVKGVGARKAEAMLGWVRLD